MTPELDPGQQPVNRATLDAIWEAAYGAGYQDGHEPDRATRDQIWAAAYRLGYDNGRAAGYQDGTDDGEAHGYQQGYRRGQADARERALWDQLWDIADDAGQSSDAFDDVDEL